MKKTMKKTTKAWAVVMYDGFIPDFTVNGKMEDVMQIHSLKSSAEKFCQGIKSPLFDVVPCTITYTIPKKKKK